MKITAEVREFARLQEGGLLNSPSPIAGKGGSRSSEREGEGAQIQGATDAEAGMAAMSQRYNEGGRELYIGQGDRERD